MAQPVILDFVAQIFGRHYGYKPRPAAEAAQKFLELIELYGMEIVIGDWIHEPVKAKTPWERMMEGFEEAAEREPWLAKEIQ